MPQAAFEVSFDKKSRAAYLRFSREKVAETVEIADGSLLVDLDHRGNLVGIEILAAGTLQLLLRSSPDQTTPAYLPRLESSQVEQIERLFEMSA